MLLSPILALVCLDHEFLATLIGYLSCTPWLARTSVKDANDVQPHAVRGKGT